MYGFLLNLCPYGRKDTAMKDTTVSLKQAAAACDAAFITHATIMSTKTQSIQANPCFGAYMKDLLEAGFDNGNTIALAEIARRAGLNKLTTEEFLVGKFKGMQRKDDKAKAKAEAEVVKAKAEVVEPVTAQPDLAKVIANAVATAVAAAMAGLNPASVAVAPVAAAPAATHPDVIRNTKVIVADAIRSQDREALKAGLVELGLVKDDCRQRFAALAKVAEQLNVGIKKHATPKSVPNLSVPNLSVQFGKTKFVN
jgi:hypothetical protein